MPLCVSLPPSPHRYLSVRPSSSLLPCLVLSLHRHPLSLSLCVLSTPCFRLSLHISPYEKGNIFNRDPVRTRRLLMHKREIRKLHALIRQDGYTLVPLSVYFKDARVKVEVGLCKGKKNYDKRDAAAQRDAKREIDRSMKERNR